MSTSSKRKFSSVKLQENICLLSDDELRKLFLNIRTQINKNKRKRNKSKDLEIELCYVQKEIQDRRDSKNKK